MNVRDKYQSDIDQQIIQHDAAQAAVIELLADRQEQLTRAPEKSSSFFARFKKQPNTAVKGLYLWGGVGRGKTYLMDIFFETLAIEQKKRQHFHRFMQMVHEQLKHYRDHQDPLVLVAKEYAKDTRVLCLDEFTVTDITDAMILAKLLDTFFLQGITLITTSNTVPNSLYKDGLQRERFLAAIDLLNTHTEVFHLQSETDYRLRILTHAKTWITPHNPQSQAQMSQYFEKIRTSDCTETPLTIYQRDIKVIKRTQNLAWFEFEALCDGPRSVADYIELSKLYKTLFINNIPVFDELKNDQARRFVELIDECYDRNVSIIATAAMDVREIYQGKRLAAMFERTISRLLEMQSEEYIARAHLA